jgi:hypothetical protein
MPIAVRLIVSISKTVAVRLKTIFMLIVSISRTAGHKEVSDVEEEI